MLRKWDSMPACFFSFLSNWVRMTCVELHALLSSLFADCLIVPFARVKSPVPLIKGVAAIALQADSGINHIWIILQM